MSLFGRFFGAFWPFGLRATVVIPDGDDQARSSAFDGQSFVLRRGDATSVEGDPVLTIDDDRVSFTNRGSASTTGETATVLVEGDKARITNQRGAEITAEDTAIEVSGERASILNRGTIEGDINGVNFANGGQSSGTLNNFGTISSDSRAVNIGGDGITVNNFGHIVGTGDQRNGTVYSDGSADDYRIVNGRSGLIDAGEGNQGAGIALQTGQFDGDEVNAWLFNFGTIEGRGQGAASSGLAGDGIRIFSGAPGGSVTFEGDIFNRGKILSESEQGATSALRVADGVGFDGKITNARGGLIDGANNGLYFGDAEHDAKVQNFGTIQSGSRAVNIDGSGVELHNFGDILGSGNQRNGTVYADATAEDYSITNFRRGLIDAGEGNNGAGIALQTGEAPGDVVEASIVNSGEVVGRGQAEAGNNQAGDGVRIFSGAGGDTTFRGDLYNSGSIVSESEQGATSAIRFSDGLGFEGEITNTRRGLIDGANNGLYFGDAAHDAEVENYGTIQSGSRAVNIDGSGVSLSNYGDILGTGNQRNGTVYADATAEDYEIVNQRGGLIDAGDGNDGAGVSLQTGNEDGDVVTASLTNRGEIVGRGDGAGNLTGDGVRLFSGIAVGTTTFQGDIVNHDEILSEEAAGVRIAERVALDGEIVNHGVIEGAVGIDASEAAGGVTVRNAGEIVGDVLLSQGDDTYDASYGGQVEGGVFGNGGSDVLIGGDSDDLLSGGGGADTIIGGDGDDVIRGGGGQDVTDGGAGVDTADFSDIGAPVVANLGSGLASYAPNPNVTIVEQLQNFENLTGSQNADRLLGDGGANVLDGLDGDDFLSGGGGADLLIGGEGDDQLRGGGGSDTTDGGEGNDTADFGDIGTAVTADLSAGTATYAGPAGTVTDTLISIENLAGSSNDDSLTGDGQANVIGGGLGSDVLNGGAGNDVLRGDELGLGTALQVTVENTLPDGGTFVTPVWFGFHDGLSFDLFTNGEAASQGLERLAEDGVVDPISAEFLAQAAGNGGVDSTLFGTAGVPGPIDPGETASTILNVEDPALARFFTWGTMIIPSNDAFLATTDDPQGEAIFDAEGNFLGPIEIVRTGADVLDAGTEVNNEQGAAFLNQAGLDDGTPENGVVGAHPGFNGSVGNPGGAPQNILGGTTASGAVIDPVIGDFTADPAAELLRVRVEALSSLGSADTLDGGAGEDTLDGGAGDDVLTGGSEADTFVFIRGTEEDQVTDYEDGDDRLDVSAFFADAADAVAAARQDGADTVIDLDVAAGDSVRLLGVQVGAIDENDFIV